MKSLLVQRLSLKNMHHGVTQSRISLIHKTPSTYYNDSVYSFTVIQCTVYVDNGPLYPTDVCDLNYCFLYFLHLINSYLFTCLWHLTESLDEICMTPQTTIFVQETWLILLFETKNWPFQFKQPLICNFFKHYVIRVTYVKEEFD